MTTKLNNYTLKRIANLYKQATTYEEGTHPNVKGFWANIPEDHSFKQNPVLSEYGEILNREGFKYTEEKIRPDFQRHPNGQQLMMKAGQILMQIMQIERAHQPELIEAAKEVAAQIMGVDKSQMDAKFQQGPQDAPEDEDQEEQEGQEQQEEEPVEITPELRAEINKRQIINTMTQGSAVHTMLSAHHLIAEKLNRISPQLLQLYNKFSSMSVHNFYVFDMQAALKAMGAGGGAIGWEKIVWEDDEEQPGQPEQPEQPEQPKQKIPKIKASAVCFPVLCQELIKGCMEILAMWGVNNNLSEAQTREVYRHSDKLEDEPWMIMIGHELWRKFLNVKPEDVPLNEVIMKFCQLVPEQVLRIVRAIIQNPNAAKEFFKPKPEAPPPRPQYQPENQENQAPEDDTPDWMPKPWTPDQE